MPAFKTKEGQSGAGPPHSKEVVIAHLHNNCFTMPYSPETMFGEGRKARPWLLFDPPKRCAGRVKQVVAKVNYLSVAQLHVYCYSNTLCLFVQSNLQ